MVRQSTHHDHSGMVKKIFPVYLICDHIGDIKNKAALFRMADAAGIRKLIFVSDEKLSDKKKLERLSRSTVKSVDHVYCSQDDLTNHLPEGLPMIALEITDDSTSYVDFSPVHEFALVIGNEKHGISEHLLKKCKQSVHIPMRGQNSSMNVAMAAGIVVFHLINAMAEASPGQT